MTTHRCEMEIVGRLELPCGDVASVEIERRWYCTLHGDAVEQSQERWSGINFFPTNFNEKQEVCGNLFDDDDEEK